MIAEKLNAMNEMELAVLEREKAIKEQEFYLKKEWEKFEEDKKKASGSQKSVIPNRSLGKISSMIEEQEVKEDKSKFTKA